MLKTSQNVGAAVMQKLLDSVMYCSEGYLVIQDLAKKFNLFGPMFDDHILNSLVLKWNPNNSDNIIAIKFIWSPLSI